MVEFEKLEKQCKEVAEEFIEELELLPIFLNYYPDVQEKWLKKIGLSEAEIKKIGEVVSKYAGEKVELENKKLPQTRKDVILIEDAVLRKMYQAKLYKLKAEDPEKAAETVLKQEYPDAVILNPEKIEKLEQLTLFKEHEKRFPMSFLIFDPEKMKIIGVQVVKDEKCMI